MSTHRCQHTDATLTGSSSPPALVLQSDRTKEHPIADAFSCVCGIQRLREKSDRWANDCCQAVVAFVDQCDCLAITAPCTAMVIRCCGLTKPEGGRDAGQRAERQTCRLPAWGESGTGGIGTRFDLCCQTVLKTRG